MNELAARNQVLRNSVEAFRQRQVAAHDARRIPSYDAYPLPALKRRIAEALSARWGKGVLEPQFEIIERERYGGDIAVKFPQLLKDGGPKAVIEKHVPWIVEELSGPAFAADIARVEAKGMYVNLTLSDRWLLDSAQAVVDVGQSFGINDSLFRSTFVVDYSSPNVAKVLHAGHIRSTIIGHVLSNMFEACGGLVFRVNHINDFGGFGFTLEGYRRFRDKFPPQLSDNGRLLEIYRIRRTAERIVGDAIPLDTVSDEDRELVGRYFGATTTDELITAFRDFVAASDARFAALEVGDKDEVELWEKMVQWSLADFDQFYQALNVSFDLIIGESFYADAGNAVVEQALAEGKAVVYTDQLAERDIALLDEQLAKKKIAETERDTLAKLVRKDVGAVVVPLDNGERYVVRRADGASIYATRDLGAIKLRREMFDPTDIVYVVGQEQQVHFDRLFRAAYGIGLASPSVLRFQHLYFGFYVDAKTGRKLSSRDTVANVNHLLAEAKAYFKGRLSERVDQSPEEVDRAARELAVGSLVFNDLQQDMKGAVEIDTSDLNATITGFEKSGGAYVVYSACRARSILRKHGKQPQPASEIAEFTIDDQEVQLLLLIQQIVEKVAQAAAKSNPAVLVRHLLATASIYNSYYMRAPVILDGVANPARLLITKAVEQSLISGLRLCHVESPEAI